MVILCIRPSQVPASQSTSRKGEGGHLIQPLAEELLVFNSHSKHSLNWKPRLPPGHFGLLRPLSQQDNSILKTGLTILGGVIDPDYPGEIGLLLYNGGKQDDV